MALMNWHVHIDEGRRGVDVDMVNRAYVCGKLSPWCTKKANGRLHLRLFGTFVCCNGTAHSVISRRVVVRVFRDALHHCASPQNPCEAIPREGSSDRSVECLQLRGDGKCSVCTYMMNRSLNNASFFRKYDGSLWAHRSCFKVSPSDLSSSFGGQELRNNLTKDLLSSLDFPGLVFEMKSSISFLEARMLELSLLAGWTSHFFRQWNREKSAQSALARARCCGWSPGLPLTHNSSPCPKLEKKNKGKSASVRTKNSNSTIFGDSTPISGQSWPRTQFKSWLKSATRVCSRNSLCASCAYLDLPGMVVRPKR